MPQQNDTLNFKSASEDQTLSNCVIIATEQKESVEELEAILANYALTVKSFAQPQAALQAVSEDQPLMVIIDLDLSEQGGCWLINQIKANAFVCHIPIVLMHSFLKHPTFLEQNHLIGSLEAISKPINKNMVENIFSLYEYMEKGREEIARLHQNSDAFFDSKNEGILGLNEKGQIIYANNSALSLLKVRPSQLIGSFFETITEHKALTARSGWSEHPVHLVCVENASILQVQKAEFWQKNAQTIPVKFAAVPIFEGEQVKIIVAFKELNPVEFQERSKDLADNKTDILTGLANQPAFMSHLVSQMDRAQQQTLVLSVFHIDLDHFTNLNETLGQEVGDALIKAVAQRLNCFSRDHDVVARLGSDEFAVCVEGLSDYDKTFAFAQKLKTQFSKPFYVSGYELYVTASIGIASFSQGAKSAELLLKQARLAAQRAKESGRNCYKLHSHFEDSQIAKRLAFDRNLREAIEDDVLKLVYRKVQRSSDLSVAWLSVLPVWENSEMGHLDTQTLKQLAMQSQMGQQLDEWTIKSTLSALRATDVEQSQLLIAFDLLVGTILNDQLVSFLQEAVKANGYRPDQIILNIPEQVVCSRGDRLVNQLKALKTCGFRLALTEFGQQFSPAHLLMSIEFDYLIFADKYLRSALSEPRLMKSMVAQFVVFSQLVKGTGVTQSFLKEDHHLSIDFDYVQEQVLSPVSLCTNENQIDHQDKNCVELTL